MPSSKLESAPVSHGPGTLLNQCRLHKTKKTQTMLTSTRGAGAEESGVSYPLFIVSARTNKRHNHHYDVVPKATCLPRALDFRVWYFPICDHQEGPRVLNRMLDSQQIDICRQQSRNWLSTSKQRKRINFGSKEKRTQTRNCASTSMMG